MNSFETMPREAQILFNPVFCGQLIHQSLLAYSKAGTIKFSFPLAFLILPIVLHKPTCFQISNRRILRPMHVWIQENQNVRLQFAERCKDFLPISQCALEFLLDNSLVSLDEDGCLAPAHKKAKKKNRIIFSNHTKPYFDTATKVGKWFAEAGDPANVYTIWGVVP